MNKKITILFGILFSVSSCKFFQKGPYKLTLLNNLKSEDDSLYLQNYYDEKDLSFNNENWLIRFRYSQEQKNIIATEFYELQKDIVYNEENKAKAEIFLNNYYFITNEKMSSLFPPEMISTSRKLFSKSYVMIYKYCDEQKIKENYYEFKYSYDNGYLFLKTCLYYTTQEGIKTCPLSFE